MKPELPEQDIDLNNDQDVNRYYNYIFTGVDMTHTVEIQDDVLENILNLVPYSLRDRFGYHTETLLIEIKEGFRRNIKKAILQFALRNPLQEYLMEVEEVRLMLNLIDQLRENREFLRNNLYLINPCMIAMLDQWVTKFRYGITRHLRCSSINESFFQEFSTYRIKGIRGAQRELGSLGFSSRGSISN